MNEQADTDKDQLESLVGHAADEYTDRINRGENVEIDEYVEQFPQIAEVLRQILPSLGLIGQLACPPKETGSPLESAGAVPEFLGEYRIVREIGRGGMGVVYEAEQKSLGRRVALKVLPFHRLMDPVYLKRFHREAQAAARLHHTNIVPVFGVGEHEGAHFYAMQYICGHGLDRVIKELRGLRRATNQTSQATRSAVSSPAASDSVSRLAQSFCTGQFPAPTSKPAAPSRNCDHASAVRTDSVATLSDQSFSQYCRSVARVGIQVAEALSYAHAQGVLHRDIKPSNLLLDSAGTVWVTDFGLAKAQSTEDLTNTGDLLGTLRYVAPERLTGQADARSDVFSLGLTLYELLTLRPAYEETTQAALVRQISAGEPPSPRKRDRRIPADLNTILEKAIAKEPERRYQTASDVATDLQRFLDDRPIRARRPSPLELAWRWCRRNPAVAGLSAAFLAALLVGFATVLWQWRSAETLRSVAEANFQTARNAVDECFTTVTQNPALQEPGMEGARQVLFQAALKYYRDFLKQRSDDAGAKVDLARAYYRLGYITQRIGSKPEALLAYRQACALFEKLAASEPASSQFRAELAQSYQSLGDLQRITGRLDKAEAEYLRALSVRENLVRSHPSEMRYQNDLAGTHQSLGTLYRISSRPAQAEASYRRAVETRERVASAQGDYRKALAQDYCELARLYAATSRLVEAEKSLAKALASLKELVRLHPESADYQDSLAAGLNFLGSFYLNSGQSSLEQVEKVYTQALGIRDQLAREHPKVQEYQSELARVYNNLALFHYIADHDDKAAENYAKALTLRVQLAEQHPEVTAYRKAVATTHHDLGLLYRRAGRWAEADRSFHEALVIQEQLLARNREISDFAIELVTTVNNLGLLAQDQGKHQTSIDWYTRAIRDLSLVLKTEPQQTDARRFLAQAHAGRAGSLSDLGRYTAALADWDRALEFARKDTISATRLGRAETLARSGRYREAVAEADLLTPHEPNSKLYFTACARVFAAAAGAAASDPNLVAADRHRRAEHFAARAMELLIRGHGLGEFRTRALVNSLRRDEAFNTLRTRSEFIRLLQKIDEGKQ